MSNKPDPLHVRLAADENRPVDPLQRECDACGSITVPGGANVLMLIRELATAREEVEKLRRELAERDQSFKLRWNADMRAIKLWQDANPGNELVWPGHADLCVWLLDQVVAEREARQRAEESDKLWQWLDSVNGYVSHDGNPEDAPFPWRCETGDERIEEWADTAREAVWKAYKSAGLPDSFEVKRFYDYDRIEMENIKTDVSRLTAALDVAREALEHYAASENWNHARTDGPIDLWVCCVEEGWNGPDFATAALAAIDAAQGKP